MSTLITIAKIDAARLKIAKNRKRKFTVPPIEQARVVTNPILITFKRGDMIIGFRRNFRVNINGALVGRVMLDSGEHVRIYNPKTLRWETYGLTQFESGFFPLSGAVGMGDYAVIGDVFHQSSGTDYCREWNRGNVSVMLRMFKPQN